MWIESLQFAERTVQARNLFTQRPHINRQSVKFFAEADTQEIRREGCGIRENGGNGWEVEFLWKVGAGK